METPPGKRTPTAAPSPSARLKRAWNCSRSLHGVFGVLLMVAVICFFIWHERGELAQIPGTVRRADPRWLIASIAAALGMHLLFALIQSNLLRKLGRRVPFPAALHMYIERQTVATVLPGGGGPPAVYLMSKRFKRFGVTTNEAVYSFVLFSAVGYVTFAALLVPVVGWLVARQGVSAGILVATSAMVVLCAVLLGVIVMAAHGRELPHRLHRLLPKPVLSFLDDVRNHDLTIGDLIPSLSMALLIDGLGVAATWFALKAVAVDATIGMAAAVYAVGTLFALIAPLFNGLGIVELSMTIMLSQFGVPPAAALGATLIYRVGEVWIPFALGIGSHTRTRRIAIGAIIRLPAVWAGFTGILSLATVIVRPSHRHIHTFERYSSIIPINVVWTISLVFGFLLLYVSLGLVRRQRLAWICAIVMSLLVIVVHGEMLLRKDRIIVAIAAANLALLLMFRRRYCVRADPPSLRRGLLFSGFAIFYALAYGVAGFYLALHRDYGQDIDAHNALVNTLSHFFLLNKDDLVPRTRYAGWFIDSFHTVGILTLVFAVISLSRPVIWRKTVAATGRHRAHELFCKYGDSSQDIFKTWPDKRYFFSSTGDAVIAHGFANGTAVALGDPAAPNRAAMDRVVREFVEFCGRNGWRIAFHQATHRHIGSYRLPGLVTLKIGEEAIVDLASFTLSGKKMKDLRAVRNRMERTGCSFVAYEAPHSDALLRQLREVSDNWLQREGRRERGFTLGAFNEDYLRNCPILAVRTAAGEILSFVNIIPSGVDGELTFDLMRHRLDAPNGAMDFAFLGLIEYGQQQGFTRLSLGMVPWAEVGDSGDAPRRERIVHLLRNYFDRFFASEGLRAYKEKFLPSWEPCYLVYSGDASLPFISLAIIRLTESPRMDGPLPELPVPTLLPRPIHDGVTSPAVATVTTLSAVRQELQQVG